jgi:hypothetical protein
MKYTGNETPRKMPTLLQVKNYWWPYLVAIGKFESEEEVKEDNYCFACGWKHPLERAHIIPRTNGGSDEPDNIHLLCHYCHKCAENIAADWQTSEEVKTAYFDWLEKWNYEYAHTCAFLRTISVNPRYQSVLKQVHALMPLLDWEAIGKLIPEDAMQLVDPVPELPVSPE